MRIWRIWQWGSENLVEENLMMEGLENLMERDLVREKGRSPAVGGWSEPGV